MSENTNNTNQELATVNTFASSAGIDFWKEALSDDCAGLEFQLDNIKIPAGGATMFELPGENEDTEMVKEITGVILFHHPAFAYYRDKYTGGNNPPDCGSYDGIVGIGTPGGDCSKCPYNQFGSADDGVSKACKNKRNMPNGMRFLPGILAENLVKTEQVVYAAEQHYSYNSGVYQPIDEMEAQRICQKNMLPSETKMYQIVDAEKQWRLLTRKSVREINANPYIINVKNGLYNVLEDSLEEHTPDYLSTVQLAVNYDKDADCPRFKQFLAESMGGDMEQVALIQEILGYFLIPVTSAQKCFVIVGAAGAGKSLLLRVINELLLSKENVSNVSWQALNERFKTAELFGKLANIFADLPTKNIDDNGIFKALVGEDFLTAEKKNKNPFSFQSTARLLFSCNSIPKNYGDRSEGFYRRLIIIRFNHTVPKEKRDPKLLEKFRYEADGIFMFALEGLKRLMDNDFNFSETKVNEDELQNYREESDSVLAFVKECCIVDTLMETGSTELFNAYKSYCEECGMKPYAQRTFVTTLMSAYPGITKGKDRLGKRRTLRGIKFEEI